MQIINAKPKKRISTFRYYVEEILTALSFFALFALIFIAYYTLTS